MVGIEFLDVTAADVLAACREKGLLVLTAKTRLRLLPPLTLTAHDVDMALEVLARCWARWSRRLRRSRHEASAENERSDPRPS